jgi:hypothetical protein
MKSIRILAALLASLTACAMGTTPEGTRPAGSSTDGTKLAPPKVLTDAPFLTDLIVDSTSVYWTDNSGAVWSVPRGGGTPVSLAATNVADDFPSLVSDGTNLYVANNTAISSVPDQGGALTALGTAPGQANAIALEAGVLYWASGFTDPTQADSAVIAAMATSGGAVTTLVSGLDAPGYVVLDDQNVYFGDIGAGTISAVSQQGGAVTVLASNQVGIGGIAVADGVVYWSNFSGPAGGIVGQPAPTPVFGDGTINAVTSDGSSSWLVAQGYAITSGIAVSDSYVYWTDGYKNTISRSAANGSETKILADDSFSVGPVLSGDSVFYCVDLPPPQNVLQLRVIAK